MAEWLMRGTVNTFFRGSIPLDTSTIFIFFLNFHNCKKKDCIFILNKKKS